MSKKIESEKKDLKENAIMPTTQNNSHQYQIIILFVLVVILFVIQVPRFLNERKSSEHLIDIEKVYREVSERIRAEINEGIVLKERESDQNCFKFKSSSSSEELKKPQDDIINEKVDANVKKVVVSDEKVVDDSAMKIQNDGKPIKIDLNEIDKKKVEEEREAELKRKKIQEGKEKARQAKEKKLQQAKKEEKTPVEKEEENEKVSIKEKSTDSVTIPDEVKNFQSTKINQIKTKKMWIPISGSNGGHRRVPASKIN